MDNSKKFISCCLLLIWLIVIFAFSNTPSATSDNQSKKIVNQIISTTNQNTKQPTNSPKEEFESDKIILQDEELEKIEYLNYIVRKTAHMSEYFILAIFTLNVIYKFKGKIEYKYYIIAISCCFAYAITDEIHQLFVPGRMGQVKDVFIDTLGAGLACLFIMLIKNTKDKKRCLKNTK